MQITQHTDYALRTLLYAACHNERLVNIAEIAATYQISKSHLMKVVPVLVKGGFIDSVRGHRGGLRLAKPPEAIIIGRVVRQTEKFTLLECFAKNNQCHIVSACRLTNVFDGAQQAFLQYLDGFTLADMLSDKLSNYLSETMLTLSP
ncbi:MAG: Rrf2 family transcriptional regulator [Gammaproteobacteria bacterium]|nr:MAG: Rrf2 family transcriptional regulator [Gammaproteobacteria bacterium]